MKTLRKVPFPLFFSTVAQRKKPGRRCGYGSAGHVRNLAMQYWMIYHREARRMGRMYNMWWLMRTYGSCKLWIVLMNPFAPAYCSAMIKTLCIGCVNQHHHSLSSTPFFCQDDNPLLLQDKNVLSKAPADMLNTIQNPLSFQKRYRSKILRKWWQITVLPFLGGCCNDTQW